MFSTKLMTKLKSLAFKNKICQTQSIRPQMNITILMRKVWGEEGSQWAFVGKQTTHDSTNLQTVAELKTVHVGNKQYMPAKLLKIYMCVCTYIYLYTKDIYMCVYIYIFNNFFHNWSSSYLQNWNQEILKTVRFFFLLITRFL